jgi:hypothetical protein
VDNFSPDFIIKCECFEDLMQERMVWIEDGGGEKVGFIKLYYKTAKRIIHYCISNYMGI